MKANNLRAADKLRAANKLRAMARWLFAAITLTSIAHPSLLNALPSDRDQPIHISADSAVREESKGETKYSGNVVLTQGSLVIRANSLVIQQDNDPDKTTIVAAGDPATLEQIPAADRAPIIAEAMRMVYRQSEELIRLRDNARIEQDGTVLTGGLIDYLMAEQRVRAVSDNAEGNQRVEVVIPPSALQKSKEES